jgi:hypothetical protein
MELTGIILAMLLSGLFAALLSVLINIWHQRRSESRRTKLQVLGQLVGNRHDIRGQAFTEALNQVFVVYYDCKDVLGALKAFHEVIISAQKTHDLANQKLLDLFKAICRDLDIDTEPLTDNFFLQAFNVKQ